MRTFQWPDGTCCVVFVSVNFDAEVYDLKSTTEDRLFGRFSYGRYGVRAGLPRLLQMFDRQRIKATTFVTVADAVRHPEAVKEIAAAGHEIGSRGADLTALPALGAAERETLASARDRLAEIAGSMPRGFRAPGGELSPATLACLAELGYQYDSSFQDDDHPYVFAPTNSTTLVELPTVWALDDSPVYSARHTHARLIKIWREEFDALYDAGGLVPITLHLRGDMGSSRAARIAALEELLAYMASRPGVRFMNGAELAEHTLTTGAAPEPDPVAPHLETLRRTPYRGDLAVKPI